ncbi:MAG: YdcF family protein, partial [Acidimicrobiales bacterium]
MSRRRHVVRWGVLVLVWVPLVYLAATFATVWRAAHHDGARPADAIVVLGAAQYDGRPSPALKARLDHVVELWRADTKAFVVVTGGKQPGDRFTEATASATYLRGQGVPEGKIKREVNGRS